MNGTALCAIHHLAYDRNLMGIDPDGVVPRRSAERPDPSRLEIRYSEFERSAA